MRIDRDSLQKVLYKCLLTGCIFVMTIWNSNKVSADVIVEPEDGFFQQHSGECEYSVREYIANGTKGYVNLYESPDSGVIITYLENEIRFWGTYTYEDSKGKVWIITEDNNLLGDTDYSSAWILLSDVVVQYDNIEFLKDHESELVQEAVSFDISSYKDTIYLWTYPLSGISDGTIDPTTEYAKNYNKDYDSYYQDEDGRKWIYIGYYMMAKGWICIDDPNNAEISDVDTSWKENTTWYSADTPKAGEQMNYEMYLIVGLVLIVVVGTALTIRHIYKKES